MKKLITLLLCVALSFTVLGAAACGGGDSTFKGDFKTEATSAEVESFLTDMNTADIIGDTTAADWKYGLDVSSNLNMNLKSSNESAKLNLGFGLKVGMSMPSADAMLPEIKAAGNIDAGFEFKMSADSTATPPFDKASVKADLYADTENFYFNGKIDAGEVMNMEGKYKLPLDMISGIIGGGSFSPMLLTAEEDTPSSDSSIETAVQEMIEALEIYGLKLYIDSSNGYKLKFVASDTTLDALLASSGTVDDSVDTTLNKFEIYVVFNAECMLTAFKVDLDAKISTQITDTEIMNVDFKAGITAKVFDGNVTLPTDLNTYVDMGGAAA